MKIENSQANMRARYSRHSRVFLKAKCFSYLAGYAMAIKNVFRNLKRYFFKHSKILVNAPVMVNDPFSKFLKQTLVIGGALLVVTSFAPARILETGFTADYFENETDYIESADDLFQPVFLINEEGFILKTSPLSEEASRIGLTDSVQHTVAPGDTLSGIAALYGVRVKTLVWENNISEESTIRVGQVLTIPPVDGISHIAANNETLSGIAKLYSVDVQLIKEHNNLESDTITSGQRLYIPGGKKRLPPPQIAVRTSPRASGRMSYRTSDTKVVMSSEASPDEGKQLIFPTVGRITQGFRPGHYGYDIANPAKPDVWAAAEGTVVKTHGGCPPREVRVDKTCGGGYGNYVVIDHGNGLQTLSAHLETVYVEEGQRVERGQSIGKMGSSGRTYGATGIHVHWEVFANGVKKSPGTYF